MRKGRAIPLSTTQIFINMRISRMHWQTLIDALSVKKMGQKESWNAKVRIIIRRMLGQTMRIRFIMSINYGFTWLSQTWKTVHLRLGGEIILTLILQHRRSLAIGEKKTGCLKKSTSSFGA